MKWVAELPKAARPGRSGKWKNVASALRERPGKWALVADGEKEVSSARQCLSRLDGIQFSQRNGLGYARAVTIATPVEAPEVPTEEE